MSNAATHKYQNTILLYFTQGKEKLGKTASKILQSSYQCFDQRYGELTTNDTEDTYVQETVTQDDVLLYDNCIILNISSWIIPEGKRIHSYYKEMEIIKD